MVRDPEGAGTGEMYPIIYISSARLIYRAGNKSIAICINNLLRKATGPLRPVRSLCLRSILIFWRFVDILLTITIVYSKPITNWGKP